MARFLGRSLILLPFICALSAIPTAAQVTTDGTLSTQVMQTGLDFTIDQGNRVGNNLFHSFGQFSVPTGGAAIFNNALDVQNIFSRVTGGSVSNIEGAIRANGNANLFLLNPSGILFGPNASLNIGGSFIGTTATSVKFADGVEFSAANASGPPLLTVSVPIGLQFGQNPEAIVNQSPNFVVNPGQTLALVGGALLLQDSYFNAPDGQIELGGVGSNSLVALIPNASGWRFGYDGVTTFQNILAQNAFVDASGDGGGSIHVWGGAIELTNGAQIYTITSGAVSGGGVTVEAKESLSVVGTNPISGFSSALVTLVAAGATGDAGNIVVQAPRLSVTDGAIIGSQGGGIGQVGNILIQASQVDLLRASPEGSASAIFTSAGSTSQGNGGNITLEAQRLTLRNGAQVAANTTGSGNAGNLTIRAGTIEAIARATDLARTGLTSSAESGATGNSGTITLEAQALSLQGGAVVISGTFGAGNSGNIAVQATTILIDNANASPTTNSGLLATSFPGATGNAGDITVSTQSLTLQNGGKLSSSVAGAGKGGNITIKAESVAAIGDYNLSSLSVISAGVTDSGVGDAGNVVIETQRLDLNGGQIVAATAGVGNAGNVMIRAADVSVTGASEDGRVPSGIFAAVGAGGKGNGGTLEIVTDRLQVNQGGEISSATFGVGNAGQVSIQASDFVRVDGANSSGTATSNISSIVDTQGIGAGGNITLQAAQLQITNGGQVSTGTIGQGNAGDIVAQVGSLLVQGHSPNGKTFSSLAATTATSFTAGSITVMANQIRLEQGGTVTVASTGAGNAGTLTLQAQQLSLQDGAQITSSSRGTGDSGTLNLQVSDRLFANNSLIFTNTVSGQGGRIQLSANQLQLENNSAIDSSTFGPGNAGAIQVNASTTTLSRSILSSQSFGSGNGGIIDLTTNALTLDNANLSSAASAQGNAGNLSLQSQRTALLNGSQISTRSTGSGDGGTIDLTGQALTLRNNASVNASTASGKGGNINLTLTGLLDLRDLSQLSAEAGGTGNGGNLNLSALFIVGRNNSDIIANAFRGNGGNIQITTQGLYGLQFRSQLTPDNDITASSEFGVNGTVRVSTIGIDPNSGLIELPVNLTDPSQQITAGCAGVQGNQFVITGRGGIPENPSQQVRRDRPWADLRDPTAFRSLSPPLPYAPTPPLLTEATTWQRNAAGQVELVAIASPSKVISFAQPSCALSAQQE